MARRPLSDAARKAISEAARARWAKFRAGKDLGAPISLGARPGRKPGKRRGRPPGSKNAVSRTVPTMSHSSMGGRGDFGGQSTGELIATRRKIDQELADRLVRDYAGN